MRTVYISSSNLPVTTMCNAPLGILDYIDLTLEPNEPTAASIREHSRHIQALFRRRLTPYEKYTVKKIKNKLRHERPGR